MKLKIVLEPSEEGGAITIEVRALLNALQPGWSRDGLQEDPEAAGGQGHRDHRRIRLLWGGFGNKRGDPGADETNADPRGVEGSGGR